VLAGKTAVAIYFSADWCLPCREFTPTLAASYTSVFKDKGMEVVLVSSDTDEAAFAEHFSKQPWASLPFGGPASGRLQHKFGVQRTPALVIVDADGKTITVEGRAAIRSDPTGERYPWRPHSPSDVLAALGGSVVSGARGRPLGIYFAAHWCPASRGFTPQLVKLYNDGLKDKMAIVFCSFDEDQAQFEKHAAEMPWPALPYTQRAEKVLLSAAMGVRAVPALAVINPADGTVVTTDGRSKLEDDPTGANITRSHADGGWGAPPAGAAAAGLEAGTEGAESPVAALLAQAAREAGRAHAGVRGGVRREGGGGGGTGAAGAGAGPLAQALHTSLLSNEAALDLRFSGVTSAGAEALSAALPGSRIRSLLLFDNQIGDTGARALAVALPRSQLTSLGLSDNRITDEGAEALAAALPHSRVTTLLLSGNRISDAGAAALARALPLSPVTKLSLSHNQISGAGLETLAAGALGTLALDVDTDHQLLRTDACKSHPDQ
jgi:thiol-disulfide isomerase/thioredoxin